MPAADAPIAKPMNHKPAKSTIFCMSLLGLNLLSKVNLIRPNGEVRNPCYMVVNRILITIALMQSITARDNCMLIVIIVRVLTIIMTTMQYFILILCTLDDLHNYTMPLTKRTYQQIETGRTTARKMSTTCIVALS